MSKRWLNLFFKTSGFLFRTKQKLVETNSFPRALPYALVVIVFEIGFAIVSIPLYLLVSPDKVQEMGFVFPVSGKEKGRDPFKIYKARRKISLSTGIGAGTFIGLKILLIFITSFFLLGGQALLAATQDWAFDTAGNYTYDSGKIEVTGGVSQLKNLSSSASGNTLNFGFDSDATNWTAVPGWINAPSKSNTASYQSTGGNPGGYVDVNLAGKKNNISAGYWSQAFITTVDNPSVATLDLDWSSISVSGSPTSFHLYAFIDTSSGNPVLGQEVWDSGNISSVLSWASISQIDISSKMPTNGTYYLKIAAHATCPAGADCNPVAGFDNTIVNWSGDVAPSYATDIPTIEPTASLQPASVTTWDSIVETATKNGGEIYYQLSDDDGSTW